MMIVGVCAGTLLTVVWSLFDHGDDGVDVDELQRLEWRRGHAARIDPGVRLAQR